MQEQTTLPLFNNKNSTVTCDAESTNEKNIKPLNQILQTPINQLTSESTMNILNATLETLFPEQQQDNKNVKKAKEVLGSLATEFSSEQLVYEIAKMQYLVDSWLDDFEKKTFDGLTLKEILHEKGGI